MMICNISEYPKSINRGKQPQLSQGLHRDENASKLPERKCLVFFLLQVSVAKTNWHLQNITCHVSGKGSALERQLTAKTFRNRGTGPME